MKQKNSRNHHYFVCSCLPHYLLQSHTAANKTSVYLSERMMLFAHEDKDCYAVSHLIGMLFVEALSEVVPSAALPFIWLRQLFLEQV